jgi:hypothetical protein
MILAAKLQSCARFGCALLLLPLGAFAQGISLSVLQDLPAVRVEVRGISPDGVRLGVEADELRTAVSDILAVGGVKMDDPAAPASLEITVNVARLSTGGSIFTLKLALREEVELVRKTANLVTVPAVTWERESLGFTSQPDRVITSARNLADRFVQEWRPANR